MIVGIVSLGVFSGYLWKLVKTIHLIYIEVDTLKKTLTHDKGDPLVHYTLINDIGREVRELRQDFEVHATGAQKHYDITEVVADSEIWTKCNVDKCPNLTKFQLVLQALQDRFSQFERTASDSRNSTSHTLDSLSTQIQQGNKDFGKELADMAKLMMGLLTENMKGRN